MGMHTVESVAVVGAIDLVKIHRNGDTGVRALDGVTVGFTRGQFTAIMEPSGSDTSTLTHCLAGLDTATSGQALIGSTDLTKLSDKALTTVRRSSSRSICCRSSPSGAGRPGSPESGVWPLIRWFLQRRFVRRLEQLRLVLHHPETHRRNRSGKPSTARGTAQVADANTGAVLAGEQDIFGAAWASKWWTARTWSSATWDGTGWTARTWTGRT
jgi:energy-coupling factor transporter ATP-binding protein EcfA2